MVLAVVIALAAAAAIEGLNTRYAASLQAKLTLVQIEAQANRLSGLQWQIAAQHTPPDDFDTVNGSARRLLCTMPSTPWPGSASPRGSRGTCALRPNRYDRDSSAFHLYLTLQTKRRSRLRWSASIPTTWRCSRSYTEPTRPSRTGAAPRQRRCSLASCWRWSSASSGSACCSGATGACGRPTRRWSCRPWSGAPAPTEEDRFRSLVQNASDVIAVVAADGTIQYLAPSIARVFGHDPAALVGTPRWLRSCTPTTSPPGSDFLTAAAAQTNLPASATWRVRHHDGSWRHVEATAANLCDDPHVRGIVLTLRDISERTALEQQLTHQAFHDPLTGLANRALFRERVEHALRRRAPP